MRTRLAIAALIWPMIQAVLFGVMFLAPNKLLFQPYLKLRERRIAGIDGARAEAERMSGEADAKLAGGEIGQAADLIEIFISRPASD